MVHAWYEAARNNKGMYVCTYAVQIAQLAY